MSHLETSSVSSGDRELLLRWLDDLLTEAEAESLSARLIAEPPLARELARLARIETLLGLHRQEPAVTLPSGLTVMKGGLATPAPVTIFAEKAAAAPAAPLWPSRKKWAAVAALVAGLLSVLWMSGGESRWSQSPVAQSPAKAEPVGEISSRVAAPQPSMAITQGVDSERKSTPETSAGGGSAEKAAEAWRQRLAQYWMPSVSLEKVPLKQAVAQLLAQAALYDKSDLQAVARYVVDLAGVNGDQLVSLQLKQVSLLTALELLASQAGGQLDASLDRGRIVAAKSQPLMSPQLPAEQLERARLAAGLPADTAWTDVAWAWGLIPEEMPPADGEPVTEGQLSPVPEAHWTAVQRAWTESAFPQPPAWRGVWIPAPQGTAPTGPPQALTAPEAEQVRAEGEKRAQELGSELVVFSSPEPIDPAAGTEVAGADAAATAAGGTVPEGGTGTGAVGLDGSVASVGLDESALASGGFFSGSSRSFSVVPAGDGLAIFTVPSGTLITLPYVPQVRSTSSTPSGGSTFSTGNYLIPMQDASGQNGYFLINVTPPTTP